MLSVDHGQVSELVQLKRYGSDMQVEVSVKCRVKTKLVWTDFVNWFEVAYHCVSFPQLISKTQSVAEFFLKALSDQHDLLLF